MVLADELKIAVEMLKGMAISEIEVGFDNYLTLDFGRVVFLELETNRGRVRIERGEWRVWVCQTYWKIQSGGLTIVDSNSKRDEVSQAISNLSKVEVTKIAVNNSLALSMDFSNSISLIVTPTSKDETDSWMLFMPNSRVFTIAGHIISLEDSGATKITE